MCYYRMDYVRSSKQIGDNSKKFEFIWAPSRASFNYIVQGHLIINVCV